MVTLSRFNTKVLPFPVAKREEQSGLSRRSLPAKWLGVLFVASAGAAWALNPTSVEVERGPQISECRDYVMEGDPQVVAQLMGSLEGAQPQLTPSLRGLSASGASRRVILYQDRVEEQRAVSGLGLARMVEEVEGEYSATGRYPELPATGGEASLGYRYSSDGQHFEIKGADSSYASTEGLQVAEDNVPTSHYRIVGQLSELSSGWGPWRTRTQDLDVQDEALANKLQWLTAAGPAPDWSARAYFPMTQDGLRGFFRSLGEKSIYTSGEFHYDAVSGTFRLKLFRSAEGRCADLQSSLLDSYVESDAAENVLVGDAQLLFDLGFGPEPKDESPVVTVRTEGRFDLNMTSALAETRLNCLRNSATPVEAGQYRDRGETESRTSAVSGRLNVVDKLGQLHTLRVSAGRGADYDWVIGQTCPQDEAEVWVGFSETEGFPEKSPSRSTVSIKAGQ